MRLPCRGTSKTEGGGAGRGGGGDLAAVLPRRHAEALAEAWSAEWRTTKTETDGIRLDALDHTLDAQRARHHGVAPEVAAEEPVARVHSLVAARIPESMQPAALDQLDALEEVELLVATSKPIEPRAAVRSIAEQNVLVPRQLVPNNINNTTTTTANNNNGSSYATMRGASAAAAGVRCQRSFLTPASRPDWLANASGTNQPNDVDTR